MWEQPQEAGDDQVDRDDVIEEPRHDQDEQARDEGDDGRKTQAHVQVHGLLS
jgi:hypothetical protein